MIKFSKEVYDALKKLALIYLPALGTLYFALGAVWGLRNPAQVVGSITAVDTFLGIILGVSSKGYSPAVDGNLVVDKTNPLKDVYSLEVATPVHEIDEKSHILLKVTPVVTAASSS